MIPPYNNIHPQAPYMQHPQYMQQPMPMYNDPMAPQIMPYNTGINPGGNQITANQSHPPQAMIDATKYSNHSNHYPFAGNTWRQ